MNQQYEKGNDKNLSAVTVLSSISLLNSLIDGVHFDTHQHSGRQVLLKTKSVEALTCQSSIWGTRFKFRSCHSILVVLLVTIGGQWDKWPQRGDNDLFCGFLCNYEVTKDWHHGMGCAVLLDLWYLLSSKKHNIHQQFVKTLQLNFQATCFGCKTAIIRPQQNIVQVHRRCVLYGITYLLQCYNIVNHMGSHRANTFYVLRLCYLLWPDGGCFTAETCRLEVKI